MNDRVQRASLALQDARLAYQNANEACSTEDIRAMAISFMIEEGRNNSSNKPAQPAPQQAPQQELGVCKDCGGAMTPGKNGKPPYCKACYIRWKEAQGQ